MTMSILKYSDMKLFRKIPGLFIAAMLSVSLSAQNNNDCYFKKGFPASDGISLMLSNKYGDINIMTVKEDSVIVCATITIDHADKEMILKSYKLISIRIGRIKDTISLSTTFDKKFFTPSYSKGRKNFSVDYLIKVPEYIDIKVINEFGNVSVEELSGSVNIRLSQGILTMKKLTRGNIRPLNRINTDHGKISIDELNWADMTIQNCPSVSIGKGKAIMINSGFSKIKIDEISSLVSDSKSDIYNIGTIKNMVSESLYSALEIENLSGQLKSKITFGSLKVSDLTDEFSTIDILSNQASINITVGDGITFMSDIKTINTSIDFPIEDYPHLVREENLNTVTITGIAGDNLKTRSLIKVRITNGKLTIQ
jgi:hypothetical protein